MKIDHFAENVIKGLEKLPNQFYAERYVKMKSLFFENFFTITYKKGKKQKTQTLITTHFYFEDFLKWWENPDLILKGKSKYSIYEFNIYRLIKFHKENIDAPKKMWDKIIGEEKKYYRINTKDIIKIGMHKEIH